MTVGVCRSCNQPVDSVSPVCPICGEPRPRGARHPLQVLFGVRARESKSQTVARLLLGGSSLAFLVLYFSTVLVVFITNSAELKNNSGFYVAVVAAVPYPLYCLAVCRYEIRRRYLLLSGALAASLILPALLYTIFLEGWFLVIIFVIWACYAMVLFRTSKSVLPKCVQGLLPILSWGAAIFAGSLLIGILAAVILLATDPHHPEGGAYVVTLALISLLPMFLASFAVFGPLAQVAEALWPSRWARATIIPCAIILNAAISVFIGIWLMFLVWG